MAFHQNDDYWDVLPFSVGEEPDDDIASPDGDQMSELPRDGKTVW